MANPTLLDIATINNTDRDIGLIEDSIESNPEIGQFSAARTIRGTEYKTLHRNTIPTVGFRNANEGQAPTKSEYFNKLVETFILDASSEVDRAVADADEDGWEAFMAREASGIMEGAMRGLASQFYYGRDTTVQTSKALNPTKGFPGLVSVVDSAFVVDAGGSSGTDGSSLYAVKWGPKDVQWVMGMDGEFQTGDVRIERLTDSNGDPFEGYRLPLLTYIGLQVVNKNSIARLKNMRASANKLTDDLIYELLEKFPTGVRPDAFYLTRRSLRQLRESRTATNPTGAPAPNPEEVDGIPLVVTDAILNTETNIT